MNTAYVNDECNWMTSCLDCFNRSEEDWAEKWAEYYSGLL